MQKLYIHRWAFLRQVNSFCKYLNANDAHVLVILFLFRIANRSSVKVLPNDIQLQHTLFALFTQLPPSDTISEAQIQFGGFENTVFKQLFVLVI